METQLLVPHGADVVVLLWDEPDSVEGGPGQTLANALAGALVQFGQVGFRWHQTPGPDLRVVATLRERGPFSRHAWLVVASSDPAAVSALFEEGWVSGDQLAFVGPDVERAGEIAALSDLRHVVLRHGEMIFASIVDGAGALIATASSEQLDLVVSAISQAVSQAGFAFVDEQAGAR